MDCIIGVDLGATQLRAILATVEGEVLNAVRQPTAAHEGPAAVIERIVACVEMMRAALPAGAGLLGLGVGAPGPLDPLTGIVFAPPNLPGWHDVPLRAILAERCGLAVELNNDANAAALGEWRFGAAAAHRDLVYVTVSTGIGGGVIADGRLLLGRLGSAGEVGQLLLDPAGPTTWEALASGTALARTAAAAMRGDPFTRLHDLAAPERVTAAHVAAAAAAGDALAVALMRREAALLGMGLASILHIYSPELVLVGGSVVTANPALLAAARSHAYRLAIAPLYRAVPIETARLGDQAGLLGAVALVLAGAGR